MNDMSLTNPSNTNVQPSAQQIALLERLSNACAVSSDEHEVRQIVRAEIEAHADEIIVDAMGNLLAVRRAQVENPLRVMLAAHMDEVGLMLIHSDGDGLFSFQTMGGIDPRQLVGKPVWVGRQRHPGVIGARPYHLSSDEEMRHSVPISQLRIDLGPGGSELAQPGDLAAFATRFQQAGPSLMGKALDDRLGVASLIEIFKTAPCNIELWAAFTVQEELGLRGARVAAFRIQPHLAIAVDSTPANDLPATDGQENTRYNTRLGFGPAIYVADRATISDPRLVRHLTETAAARGIPFQYRQPGGGSTDAGAILRAQSGVPVISVSVPGRYAHTACLVARAADWGATMALLQASLQTLTTDILKEERRP